MATYGYSAGYQGGGPQAVPSGYIDAYAQAGRNIGQGIQQIGNAIGESLQRYGQNKAESEFLTQRLESLAPYLQSMAQSGNVMDERSPESKILGDIKKFGSMSTPQKKAALLNAEFFLDRADKQRARELTDEATRQQLQLGALQLGQAQKQAEAAPFLTKAMLDIASRKPGQGPSVPYANVTEEMIGKYGNKLTPEMLPSFMQQIQRMNQTLPAGLVPTGAKMGPSGLETEYGVPQTPSMPAYPNAPGYFQPMIGDKTSGPPIKIEPQVQAEINLLPKEQKDWANETNQTIRKFEPFIKLNEQVQAYNELNNLGTSPSEDVALIFKYMKTLDPGAIVTKSDFDNAASKGSLPTRVQNWYNGIATGNPLTDKVRGEIKTAAKSILVSAIDSIDPIIKGIESDAKYRGVPMKAVMPEETYNNWKKTRNNILAESLQRFQSPEEMRAKGLTKALIFNPTKGKYQLWED